MAVKITILSPDNIEDLSAVEIKKEIVEAFGINVDCVNVSKITTRQYKVLTER